MSEQHTPEPWLTVDRGGSYTHDIDAGDVSVALNVGRENAERIVASVNACIGSKTQGLKHYASLGGVEKIMSLLEQERDELNVAVAELVQILKWSVEVLANEHKKNSGLSAKYIYDVKTTAEKVIAKHDK